MKRESILYFVRFIFSLLYFHLSSTLNFLYILEFCINSRLRVGKRSAVVKNICNIIQEMADEFRLNIISLLNSPTAGCRQPTVKQKAFFLHSFFLHLLSEKITKNNLMLFIVDFLNWLVLALVLAQLSFYSLIKDAFFLSFFMLDWELETVETECDVM